MVWACPLTLAEPWCPSVPSHVAPPLTYTAAQRGSRKGATNRKSSAPSAQISKGQGLISIYLTPPGEFHCKAVSFPETKQEHEISGTSSSRGMDLQKQELVLTR